MSTWKEAAQRYKTQNNKHMKALTHTQALAEAARDEAIASIVQFFMSEAGKDAVALLKASHSEIVVLKTNDGNESRITPSRFVVEAGPEGVYFYSLASEESVKEAVSALVNKAQQKDFILSGLLTTIESQLDRIADRAPLVKE